MEKKKKIIILSVTAVVIIITIILFFATRKKPEATTTAGKSILEGKTPKVTTPSTPDNNAIAQQVIAGQWGNGEERRQRLTAAGYDYEAIQAIVNQQMKA